MPTVGGGYHTLKLLQLLLLCARHVIYLLGLSSGVWGSLRGFRRIPAPSPLSGVAAHTWFSGLSGALHICTGEMIFHRSSRTQRPKLPQRITPESPQIISPARLRDQPDAEKARGASWIRYCSFVCFGGGLAPFAFIDGPTPTFGGHRGSISARWASFFYHSPPMPVFAPTSPNNLEYLLAVSKNLVRPLHPVYDDGKGGGWKW